MSTQNFLIESTCLGERRAVTIFLPPNHDSANRAPIVFCADGQTIATFSKRIERDISDQELREVVLVGVHSSQQRSPEYIVNEDDLRFRLHEQFFTEELPDWLCVEFGLATDRNRTGVFGFSHGGAFALTMASRHRELFGLVIAFSTTGEFEQFEITEQSTVPAPRFYLSAGTREKPLLKTTRRIASQLRRLNVEHVITERLAGHERGYWETELPIALRWGFATSNSSNTWDITK